MCEHGDTVQCWNPKSGWFGVDRCIAPIVDGLNHRHIYTAASCCGHGHRPGAIALADGRELILVPDFDTARRIDALFPLNIHGEPRATPSDDHTDQGAGS